MALHRLRQGLRVFFAFAQSVDDTLAEHYLTSEQTALFNQMRRSERLHSLNVLRTVLAQGETPPDLAAAALLHDVGKTRYPLALYQRTAAVLLRHFAPAIFERLSKGDPRRWWSRGCVVAVQHPAWSAELVAQAGALETMTWLVAHHQDDAERWEGHPLYPLLQRLQMADDTN